MQDIVKAIEAAGWGAPVQVSGGPEWYRDHRRLAFGADWSFMILDIGPFIILEHQRPDESVSEFFGRFLQAGCPRGTVAELTGVVWPAVDVVAALAAAGWTEGQRDDDRTWTQWGWLIIVRNLGPKEFDAVFIYDHHEAGHGDTVARAYGPYDSAPAALSALMALPFGAVTVGVFCGVVA